MNKVSKELTAASSVPIILSILQQGETYGYEIIRKLALLSQTEIQWTDSMLYPVLHKLEEKIDLWKDSLQEAGAFSEDQRYELEDHLQEKLNDLLASGYSEAVVFHH
jgi:DNA-binding PadR family transcriptional regulator